MPLAHIAVTGAATDTEIVAAQGARKQIVINRIHVTTSAAGTVSVSQGADASGTRFIHTDLAANGAFVFEGQGTLAGWRPFHILPVNTALNITNSAGNLKGIVDYTVLNYT